MAQDSTFLPANTKSPPQLIQSWPMELLVAILKHVPDPQALKSLILSCSAFSTAYYSHQRQTLLHLVRNTFDVDKVNIATPLLACRAQHIDVLSATHLETVTTLLKANLERIEPTKQAIHEISVEECKQMLRLKRVASQICNDLISQVPLHHPLGRENVMSYKPLSTTERRRITIAIYRWELWAKLFSKRVPGILQKQDSAARIDINTQMAVYLARYTRWEQEQLSCLYDYVHRRYNQLFEESAKWYHEKNPGPFSPEEGMVEELKPWERLYDNPTSAHCSLAGITSRGPQVLASLLKTIDPGWRCGTIMNYIYNFEPFFVEIISPEFPENVFIPAANEEDTGVQKDDQPYGYKWAFANKSIKPGEPSFWGACDFLWHWGYAFWDEDRLQNWGFEIGGPFFYAEEGDEAEGILDRVSGRQLQERQWPTNLVTG